MKKAINLLLMGFVTISCCCCIGGKKDKDIVKETYVHKYGVSIAKNDWERRGSDGKVISLLADGVTVTKSYSEGVLDGNTTYSFPYQITIERTFVYNNGSLVKEVQNYINGTPKRELVFMPEEKRKVTIWYQDGSPQSIEFYDNNVIVTGQYFNLLNEIESSVENGNGIRTRRDKLGHLISRDTLENNAMTISQTYFSNGEPKEMTAYQGNMIHGAKKTFLVGGEPRTIENWVEGYQHGITTIFQNGEKYSEISYYMGKKHGTEKRFNSAGDVVEEISWDEGSKHGPTKHYIADEVRTDWFYQGKPVASKFMFMEHGSRT